MKAAVMQPYFFPYIGYYQLAYEVDEFVFFDDVNFIKRGYINRNSILLNGGKFDFSVPVSNISQNRTIAEHEYIGDFQPFLRHILQAYRKAPFFDDVFSIIECVTTTAGKSVAKVNAESLKSVFQYLGINRHYSFASDFSIPDIHKGQERILRICQKLDATGYRNAIGGRELYDPIVFADRGIEIKFVRTSNLHYKQANIPFVPNLSMIDVLMWNAPEQVIGLLRSYSLE